MSEAEKQPKVSQRAARKAAAACLARQRHKSFVNTLQDSIEARKSRVGVLKRRREDYFLVVAAHMIRGIRTQLSPEREAELQTWLARSDQLALAWAEPPEEAWVAVRAAAAAAAAAASLEAEGAAGPSNGGFSHGSFSAIEEMLLRPLTPVRSKKAPPLKDTMKLDEALAQQEFVTDAMVKLTEEAAFSDDEIFDASMVLVNEMEDVDEIDDLDDLDDDEDDEDGVDFEMYDVNEAYGDGLVALLQHLSADRRSTVQAWLQLKDDTEGKQYSDSTWTNLSALEEDFLLINSEHRPDATYGPGIGPMRSTLRT